MEIEKLKDMLRNASGGPVGIQMCQEAADALEQLQAENDSLKGERDAVLESFPHECNSCRYQTIFFNGYAPVYGCTNPDGHCLNNYDKWQWRGPKGE